MDFWYLSHPANDWDRVRAASWPLLTHIQDSPDVAALRRAVQLP